MSKGEHIVTKRLLPGQDLRQELETLSKEHDIKAGVLLSLVGGLHHATLRMPGAQPDNQCIREWEGPFEIVSGTGTFSHDGIHIHIAVSDVNGLVIGGHLKNGCIIANTVEVVIQSFSEMVYRRIMDPATGFTELSVE